MSLPVILINEPTANAISALQGKAECLEWSDAEQRQQEIEGLLIFGHRTIDGKVMDQFPNLKIISNCGVGVDHIRLEDAKQRRIPVGNTPGVLSATTADMAFTLLLAAGRRLIEGDHYARSKAFTHFDSNYMLGTEVHHTTLGIIGMGRIGCEVAKRAMGFDMKILYHNRSPKANDETDFAATYVSKDELLRKSDYIVVVVPLNEQTREMISDEEFAIMKSSAVFVNISRGGVVNTDALTRALQNNQIYAAGLDVTEPEPLPRGHKLLSQPNLTLAPHLGSATTQTRLAMQDLAISNLLNGLAGKTIVSSVM
jgi:glyoxylate reductase